MPYYCALATLLIHWLAGLVGNTWCRHTLPWLVIMIVIRCIIHHRRIVHVHVRIICADHPMMRICRWCTPFLCCDPLYSSSQSLFHPSIYASSSSSMIDNRMPSSICLMNMCCHLAHCPFHYPLCCALIGCGLLLDKSSSIYTCVCIHRWHQSSTQTRTPFAILIREIHEWNDAVYHCVMNTPRKTYDARMALPWLWCHPHPLTTTRPTHIQRVCVTAA